jgi:hypothetical protein
LEQNTTRVKISTKKFPLFSLFFWFKHRMCREDRDFMSRASVQELCQPSSAAAAAAAAAQDEGTYQVKSEDKKMLNRNFWCQFACGAFSFR